MRILVAIYLVIIVGGMVVCCSLGHAEKRGKFRNENPKVQMVQRCFNALKANLFNSLWYTTRKNGSNSMTKKLCGWSKLIYDFCCFKRPTKNWIPFHGIFIDLPLKRGKLDVKARFLCHALIKTFLLEQQLEQLDPSPERIMSRSGEDSDVSTIQAVKNIN